MGRFLSEASALLEFVSLFSFSTHCVPLAEEKLSARSADSFKGKAYRALYSFDQFRGLGPVVRRLISANPGLRFNLGFFISFFKSLFQIIFFIIFGASKHHIVGKKNYTECSFKAFIPEVRFYINPWLS